jgi:filamentous hemagglutinin
MAGIKAKNNKDSAAQPKALLTPAEQFEKDLVRLPPGERVAVVKQNASSIAQANGWEKDSRLSKLNDRDVYKSADGTLYSLDTQHGRWEKVNPKTGAHEGEFRLVDGKFVEGSIDNKGLHDLKVK